MSKSSPERLTEVYCERFVELLIDLLSQLPTRRFVHTLLEDRAVLIKCKMSAVCRGPHRSQLFGQLVDLLQFYLQFEINNHTGDPQSEEDVVLQQYDRVQQFQRLAFAHIPKLRELSLLHCGAVSARESLLKYLSLLSPEELRHLAIRQLRLAADSDPLADKDEFLREVIVSHFERRRFRREVLNEMPLYPTEELLFDENRIPSVNYSGESCLALPKLNLQFLSFHDYLLRNFTLFQLESTYEVREDMLDVVKRLQPAQDEVGATFFKGWSRMAVPLNAFKITEVKAPHIGEKKPSAVTAEVHYTVESFPFNIRAEWDELRQHDVVFLLTIRALRREAHQVRGARGGGGCTRHAMPRPVPRCRPEASQLA